ncbi:LysR substrate-binding domain-containing protein [Marinobacter salicampi]|uniref:LysR substrate-binding domain-containing protein n=1 Tax=Marinobacter salicampi TaxID=435907 RepID=UPI00140AE73C|nr:LysR substrate-binding domain-containing protein [Marinobacter salicampi]
MLEIRHLKTVQALAECGSLTRAADSLHVTQSALSHQLRDLEGFFGVTMYHRKSRPLRLTPAGQALLDLAHNLLPEVRDVENTLLKLGRGKQGRLRMAIECHSCYLWLIPSVNAYRAQWSDVELDFIGHLNFEPLPALAQGELDLVVTSDPVEMPGLVYVPLFRFEIQLAVAPQHPLADCARIEPHQLADQTLLIYPVAEHRLDIFRHFMTPAGVRPQAVRTAEMTMMIAQLVASQRGVAALPTWALQEYETAGLLKGRPLGEGLWSDLYAAVRVEDRDQPFMQAFLDTVARTSFQELTNIRRFDVHAD